MSYLLRRRAADHRTVHDVEPPDKDKSHTLAPALQIARAFCLDGVGTLADAANGMKTPDQHFEALLQVAVGDVLTLSE